MPVNFVEQARADLKTLLAAFPNVYEYRPEGVTPPVIFIEPQDDYLRPGQSFADWKLSLALLCVGEQATNQQSTKNLDTTVTTVIETLRGEWTVEGVRAGVVTYGQYDYSTAVINISTNLNL